MQRHAQNANRNAREKHIRTTLRHEAVGAVVYSASSTTEGHHAPARSRRLGLKTVVTGLVLATVVLTALLVHLLWSISARENVADVARQLDHQIVASIQHELHGVLDQAVAVQRAVASMFSNGTIAPEDEPRRDFIFLALLRSQPSLSWISLGTPDGDFFGAGKLRDDVYDLVSVQWDSAKGTARERTFRFQAFGPDMVFSGNEMQGSTYKAIDQDWYRRAVQEDGPGWNLASGLPHPDRAAISTSTPLVINTMFRGVINVVIELERLSTFLATLKVGNSGTAVIIDRRGEIIAAADPRAIEQQQRGEMPTLRELAHGNPMLALVDYAIREMQVALPRINETRLLEIRSPTDGQSYYVTFGTLNFQGWVVAAIIPASDFLASIEKSTRILLVVLVVLTLVIAGLAVLLAHIMFARPLTRLAGQLKHLESFHLDRVKHVGSRLRELDELSHALLQMSRGLASFEKYIPTELVRTLVSRGIEVRPGGSHETLTVLFADLAGFTALSEKLGGDVVPVLTEYLETVSAAIVAHQGTIDKFIGDAVMAFWGAPIADDQHARHACAAALACRQAVAAWRAPMLPDDPRRTLGVRIGINTGLMLVGNIGSTDRLNYTVIGDPVNVASRLEALNKRYGTEIMIGEETRRIAGDAIIARQLDWIAVYGHAEGSAVYELLAMADAGDRSRFAWVEDYESGLVAYRERRWEEAQQHFLAANTAREGGDRPSIIFIERCRTLLASPPGPHWSHVTVLMEK